MNTQKRFSRRNFISLSALGMGFGLTDFADKYQEKLTGKEPIHSEVSIQSLNYYQEMFRHC